MERSTQIGVGLVVLAALGGAVYFKAKEDQKIGTSQMTSAELPELKTPDDVDKVSITNGDKGEVVLEKKGDKWEVTKPVNAPANQTNAKALVDSLKELKAKELIAAAPSEDQKKEFQFEPSKAVHVVAYKGGDKKLDATFGKSGARGQMAMVDGKPGVFAVSGYSSYAYTREVKGWRDTEIFKFDDGNATQIMIENANGPLSFTKGDHWAGTAKGKPIAELDDDKVKDTVRAFNSLNAEDFGDGKSPADTGLDAPEGKITIALKDGAGNYTLKIGKVASGTSHYAQKEGDSTIFVVPERVVNKVITEPSKFQKSKDAGADAAKGAAAMPVGMPGMPGMPHGMPAGMGGDPHGH
ncbi:DUF4340 domain-containing protein [Labilithrix luteola]|uniref:DUF4340 domain-containing protein n=1 Tax=Labilithrix luteola TaxID=1391654 RepID=UPI000ADCBFA5|nr:DUF4340 domain-containing protein [Labilithrix luteola]